MAFEAAFADLPEGDERQGAGTDDALPGQGDAGYPVGLGHPAEQQFDRAGFSGFRIGAPQQCECGGLGGAEQLADDFGGGGGAGRSGGNRSVRAMRGFSSKERRVPDMSPEAGMVSN